MTRSSLAKSSLVLLLTFGVSAGAQNYRPENKPDNAWSAMTTPTQGAPEAIGSYANGCMAGAMTLPASGQGFIDMRRNRNRFYGQPKLIGFIKTLGKFIHQRYRENLLIGDLSQPRGGRMNFGHSSHQIGLDVDIWITPVPDGQPVNPNRDMVSIVDKATGTLKYPMSPATRDALYFSATHQDVARIFVNPVIKWHLCTTEADTSWLRKLRAWWGHDAHFHVRMSCDDDQPDCKNQTPPPPGDGCNTALYNWVDEQSGRVTGRIKPKKRKHKTKRKPKQPPMRCQMLQWD